MGRSLLSKIFGIKTTTRRREKEIKEKKKRKEEKKKKKSKGHHEKLLPTAKNRTGNLQVKVAGQLLYHEFSPRTCTTLFMMTLIH